MQRIGTPPIYIIAPGRVYRRDNLDATHLPYFMQLEGLAVDEGLTVGDLKGTLLYMVQSLFGPERQVRMRPASLRLHRAELRVRHDVRPLHGQGLPQLRRRRAGWRPAAAAWSTRRSCATGASTPSATPGYAWGFGIERMALLKYDVEDLRLFYENDLRFNRQF